MSARDDEVRQALARLREADAAREAPASLETRLAAALRAERTAASRRRPGGLGLAALAAALVVAAAVALVSRRPESPPPDAQRATDPGAEFAPLVYGEPLEGADALHLTRVRVPRRALASFGWALAEGDDDGPPVEAEVLVGQDGLARGIRFVSDDGGPWR
jgi:hypothetical protein